MQKAKRIVWDFFKVTLITVGLFLFVDLIAGDRIIVALRQAEPFRVQHSTYHHTLRPNYDGLGRWGDWTYKMCTNLHGFKDKCNAPANESKSFDVAFMGDSFTEGIGVPFEESFVGRVSNDNPGLRIANLGVVSYSPAIYLAKLKDLYAKGYSFKHVIVFIDIGDAYDEANAYDLHDETVVVDKGEPYPLRGLRYLRRFASKNFPLTGEAWVQVRKIPKQFIANQPTGPNASPVLTLPATVASSPNSESPERTLRTESAQTTHTDEKPFVQNIYEGIYLKNYPKSEWTYNTKSTEYGSDGVMGTLEKMKREMNALYILTKSNGSTLSIGVYPWPGQILHDIEDSLQVQTWREFCSTRCLHFYNVFPTFFNLAQESSKDSVVQKYYFAGDAHFNALGNKIVADVITAQGIK